MAYYTGYVTLPIDSYTNWKNATNGNGFNYDETYGCQCYDLAVEFWYNVGFPQGYPLINNSSAYTMWTNREANASYNGTTYFDLIYNVQDIQVGDIIVFDASPNNIYGHVGFADVNYTDSGWTYPELPILSQANGGTPDSQGGAYTNVHGYDITLFLGAFRFRSWHQSPMVQYNPRKNKFKWAIYARKLRDNR